MILRTFEFVLLGYKASSPLAVKSVSTSIAASVVAGNWEMGRRYHGFESASRRNNNRPLYGHRVMLIPNLIRLFPAE